MSRSDGSDLPKLMDWLHVRPTGWFANWVIIIIWKRHPVVIVLGLLGGRIDDCRRRSDRLVMQTFPRGFQGIYRCQSVEGTNPQGIVIARQGRNIKRKLELLLDNK